MQHRDLFRTALIAGIAFVLMLRPIPAEAQPGLPPDLLALFQRLDKLGLDAIEDARYVTLDLKDVAGRHYDLGWSENAWVLTEDSNQITVLQDDLRPQTYNKNGPTTLPHAYSPLVVTLTAIHDTDFESRLREVVAKPDQAEEHGCSFALFINRPATRALIAYAAWKKGLEKYGMPTIQGDCIYQRDGAKKYVEEVEEHLAWLHFECGVNLLMFPDRKQAIAHLELSLELSPNADFGEDRTELISTLEKITADEAGKKKSAAIDPSGLSESERATYFVEQIKDMHCDQGGQPDSINPFGGMYTIYGSIHSRFSNEVDESLPTSKLRALGIAAVPALIAALDDNTPTRTVHHWRDYMRHRRVWRVSDFAWNVLRDLAKRGFGYELGTRSTLSDMAPEDKKAAINEIKSWYAQNAGMSQDDQMLALFELQNYDEWRTAGTYFLRKHDNRAVAPLIRNIPKALPFEQGRLCRLVASFDDPAATEVIRGVMANAPEPSDRIGAAIALYQLGDTSGIPVAINFAKMEEQPYGDWEEPVWLLMHSKTPESMVTLKHLLLNGSPQRTSELLESIASLIPGSSWSEPPLEPAGCVELCPILIAAMDRAAPLGESNFQPNFRVRDQAAMVFALMKGHAKELMPGYIDGRFLEIDPAVFDQNEPDIAKRDEQIKALKKWYKENKNNLAWNTETRKLEVRPFERN